MFNFIVGNKSAFSKGLARSTRTSLLDSLPAQS
jgi:hypothetical protein